MTGGRSGSWGGEAIVAMPSIAGHWLLTAGLIWLAVLVILFIAGFRGHRNGFFTDEAPPTPPRKRERHLRSVKR
jgi:hypothetical protein